jgi:hypothetical protein
MSPTFPTLGPQETPIEYERAQTIAEGFLVGIAQSRRVVTYTELGDVIVKATGHEIYRPMYGRFLGDLVDRTFSLYGVMLSSLVVKSGDFSPGMGFGPLPTTWVFAALARTTWP